MGPILLFVKNVCFGTILTRRFKAMGSWKHAGATNILVILLSLLIPETTMGFGPGKVVDIITKKPIEGALILSGKDVQRTDANGLFAKTNGGYKVAVRAPGYLRTEEMGTCCLDFLDLAAPPLVLSL